MKSTHLKLETKKTYSASCADLNGECDNSIGLSCLPSVGAKACLLVLIKLDLS